MYNWSSFPFLRYVLWLIAGIVTAMVLPESFSFSWWIGAVLAGGVYLVFYVFKKSIPHSQLYAGVFACIFLFLLGFGRVQERRSERKIDSLPLQEGYWLLEAVEDGTETAKTTKVKVRINAFKSGAGWKGTGGQALIYIRKDSLGHSFRYGDKLLVKAALQEIPPPLNPASFNYREYLAGQGIFRQAFITKEQVVFVSHEPESELVMLAKNIRRWASRQLELYIPDGRNVAIVKALVLGNREALDEELSAAWATAGVMHILAVSGLHVGFIYAFLQLLLKPWRRHRKLKWAGFLCTVLVLCAYALITGLSPSVLRATLMFCLLDFGRLLKRKASTYNTIAVAAFVLLLYDPFMLKAIGFQLSFLAVAGIVYLQPKLAGLYKGSFPPARFLWDLLAVSIAAQLATFPLGLYYFGQFPTWFFLSNLVVVPVAGFILGLGLFLLFASLFSSWLASLTGMLTGWLLWLVNQTIFFTERLPFSRLTTFIDERQVFLLMLFLLFLLVFLRYRKFGWWVVTFFTGLLFLSDLFLGEYYQRRQKKMIVYHIPGYSSLHLVEGRQEFLLMSGEVPANRLKYQIQPNRRKLGLRGEDPALFSAFDPAAAVGKEFQVVRWSGLSLVKVEEPLASPCKQAKPLEVDYLILTANSVQDLEKLGCYFKAGKIIIDGSNQFYVQKRLQEQAERLNLSYHITAHAGAFELNR